MTGPEAEALLLRRVQERTTEVVEALAAAGADALRSASALPGWSRLTIACHLRYGAQASHRMTADALAGRPTSFYPGGRAAERPATLVPGAGEDPAAVVASLGEQRDVLHGAWASLRPAQWSTPVGEPAGRADLGPVTLGTLVLLRLTEVEVHGVDLGLDLSDWSETFVAHALPFRLGWLAHRRSNHREVDGAPEGSWLLVAGDGPTWRVEVRAGRVSSVPAGPAASADAVLEGTSRDLLALLLGRRPRRALRTTGDRHLAAAFVRAFPGP